MDEIKLLLGRLRRLLYSRGRSTDDTDDLIQEAFLRLQQYRDKQAVGNTEAFLVRTVLNLSADLQRRHRVERIVPDALESLSVVDPSPPPDVVLAGQERLLRFKRGLRAISPRQREVFILHRVEGYSFPQIAKELDISVSMAEKHAARALIFMMNWMKK